MNPSDPAVVNIHAAKTQLSRLVDEAAAGRSVIITRAGRPAACAGRPRCAAAGRGAGRVRGRLNRLVRLLLDTRILLWALASDRRLSPRTRDWVEDPADDVLFSAASIREIAIRSALQRLEFGVGPNEVAEAARATGFVELAVRAGAAARVASLPPHHRDPFDRLLVAQAIEETVRLITAGRQPVPYSELVTLVG